MRLGNVAALVVSFVVTFTAAAVGGIASIRAVDFYRQLDRPAWAPPSWLFGPVWTVLYVAMAIAAWLVWRERTSVPVAGALALFGAQLALNALWTWLFFAWRRGGWSFAEVVLLWVVLVLTIVAFWRARPIAGAMLLPYLAWVSFATALTWAVWRRNPDLL